MAWALKKLLVRYVATTLRASVGLTARLGSPLLVVGSALRFVSNTPLACGVPVGLATGEPASTRDTAAPVATAARRVREAMPRTVIIRTYRVKAGAGPAAPRRAAGR